jgi:Gram-negative bacterial TonB protein C-terminal
MQVLNNIGDSISFADLQVRRVPVEWFEAVALIQELSRVLLESGTDPAQPSLAPQAIWIDPNGNLRLSAKSADAEPVVRRVGELLRMCLGDSAFPAPLRLVIIQSAATPPFYGSLAELTNALAYFERPNRTALIRGVFERAQTHQPLPPLVDQPEQMPVKKDLPAAPGRHRLRISRRAIGATAAALTMIVVAVGVSQLVTWRDDSVPVGDEPKGSVVDQASSEASSRRSSNDNARATDPVLAPRRAATAAVTSLDPAEEHVLAGALTMIDVAVTEPEPLATSEASFANAPDTNIYSASDEAVTPPVAIYMRLPARPSAGVHVEDHSTIELLVGETGSVESVKVLGPPHDLGEALLVTLNLSAAKTWRFRPALRDGQPVRYRTVVQVWPSTR